MMLASTMKKSWKCQVLIRARSGVSIREGRCLAGTTRAPDYNCAKHPTAACPNPQATNRAVCPAVPGRCPSRGRWPRAGTQGRRVHFWLKAPAQGSTHARFASEPVGARQTLGCACLFSVIGYSLEVRSCSLPALRLTRMLSTLPARKCHTFAVHPTSIRDRTALRQCMVDTEITIDVLSFRVFCLDLQDQTATLGPLTTRDRRRLTNTTITLQEGNH